MTNFIYRGPKTAEISFPLGGIGTGCIGLAGNGRLVDWEIYNRPNKGSINGFSHFAVKAESGGRLLDARVLNGDLPGPYTGEPNRPAFQGFGFGPNRGTMAGVPHFRDVEFRGEFPIATLRFIDDSFPGRVMMTAFNPFIPLNDRDSSIPAAFFEVEIENTAALSVDYTVAASLASPPAAGTTVDEYKAEGGVRLVHLRSVKHRPDDPEFGDICVATDADDADCQEYWYRGRWFDSLEIFWREFARPGRLPERSYPAPGEGGKEYPGGSDVCTLAAHLTVAPGSRAAVRFVISWSFPNCTNYWQPEKDACACTDSCCGQTPKPRTWKNHYATLYEDSTRSAIYALANWDRLSAETLAFKEALFSSSLPPTALEAVSANLSVLKTPTCLRLTDGSFYGFEGCRCDAGCCEGSCTHVWNYAYALPFLFPKLERSMRELDFRYNQRADGGMAFRLQLPLGRERSSFRPCADGQFGGVVKMYRDWKICGDTAWLRSLWPAVKKSIEFAWADTNEDRWDADRDGVLEGRQHHTLDMELFGPNSWLTGFYLAALKAGAEMAEALGEAATAREYRELFERGRRWVDRHLFNGRYYHQLVDLRDKSILEEYASGTSLHGDDVMAAYWNDEAGEMKYQIAEGSEIDQLNAQWHAHICGLGDIFDPAQRKTALKSLFHYNFKGDMRGFFNPCRLYCLNDESGLVICEWPEDVHKPVVPLPYSGETQNGYEYQAAILMIQEGLVEEGMEAVKAIRDRYDGRKRNPWNEFECGSNYARSMASFSLVPTFSGFSFDMTRCRIGFDPIALRNGIPRGPRTPEPEYTTFWSLDCGWGTFRVAGGVASLRVVSGAIALQALTLPFARGRVTGATLNDAAAPFTASGDTVEFSPAATVHAGERLDIALA